MNAEPEPPEGEDEFMAMLPDAVKAQIAEAKALEETALREAHNAGVEAARRRLGVAGIENRDGDVLKRAVGDLPPRARHDDPEESHDAADSVEGLTESQNAVLSVLRRLGPLTDERLVQFYEGPRQSPSGIRTRRHELVEGKYVYRTGVTVLSTGRRAALWGVVAREETENGAPDSHPVWDDLDGGDQA